MGRPTHLREVTDETRPLNAIGRWQGVDDVFFHRSQIRKGVRLIWFGRTNHGDVYVVDEIRTLKVNRLGNLKEIPVDACVHMTDWIVLKRIGSNQWITRSFAALSYNAAWRLVT